MQSALMVVGLPVVLDSNSEVRREKEESVHCPGQNAVSCKNYRHSFKYHGATPAEERRKSNFRLMLTCSSRKLCVISIFDHKSIR